MRSALPLAAVLALACSGCLSFGFARETIDRPIEDAAIADLAPGTATLGEALERLGAPVYVWEYAGDGAALAWGWLERDERGISVSVPVSDQGSISGSYDVADAATRGVLLLFGPDLVLQEARTGYLRDLRAQIERQRPAYVE